MKVRMDFPVAHASRRRGLWKTPTRSFAWKHSRRKVRFGGTPKPARGTRALPGLLVALALFPINAFAAAPAVDARNYPGSAWSPYIVGAGIGVLSWLTFYFANKPIGASSFYATVAGGLGRLFSRRHTESLAYYTENPPRAGWDIVFILATIVGGFIAAWSGGEFTNQWVPPLWAARFGEGSLLLHGVIGVAGGILMAFGARFAGGCTSGPGTVARCN